MTFLLLNSPKDSLSREVCREQECVLPSSELSLAAADLSPAWVLLVMLT